MSDDREDAERMNAAVREIDNGELLTSLWAERLVLGCLAADVGDELGGNSTAQLVFLEVGRAVEAGDSNAVVGLICRLTILLARASLEVAGSRERCVADLEQLVAVHTSEMHRRIGQVS